MAISEEAVEDHRRKIRNLTYELSQAVLTWNSFQRGEVIFREHLDLRTFGCVAVDVVFMDELGSKRVPT